MKYCLSIHQPKEYLKKVDEIYVSWKDQKYILDVIKVNPNANIVLLLDVDEISDDEWREVGRLDIICQGKLKLCCYTVDQLVLAKEKEFKFFFAEIINNCYELNAIIDFGVCDVRIGGLLMHQLDYISTIKNVEFRIYPNRSNSFLGYKPNIGGWVRPEDIDKLTMIHTCEFFSKDLDEERANYRIYAENHEWPGRLNLLIKDLTSEATNRLIPPDFQDKRSNCYMLCQTKGFCNFCETTLKLANPDILHQVKR